MGVFALAQKEKTQRHREITEKIEKTKEEDRTTEKLCPQGTKIAE